MKKSVMLVLCILLGMLFVASMAFASLGGTGIKGTPHDLSSTGQGSGYGSGLTQDPQDRICVYCHAPHNTVLDADAQGITYHPLWNHALSAQIYTPYSNGTDLPNDLAHQSQAMVLLQGKQPGGVSRLCLSCHDGVLATNQYGYYGATSTDPGSHKIAQGSPFSIGYLGNLTNHHPIGFSYDTAQSQDAGLAPSATTVLTGNGAFASKYIKDLLWNNNMECTTCHDVHNTGNATDAIKFLWKADNGSALCLTCHLKAQKAP